MKKIALCFFCLALLLTGCSRELNTVPEETEPAVNDTVVDTSDDPVKEQHPEEESEDPEELPELEPELPDHVLPYGNGDVSVYELEENVDGLLSRKRVYQIYNGDVVTMGRISGESGMHLIGQWTLDCEEVTIRYYDPSSDEWIQDSLQEGIYRHSMVDLAAADGSSITAYTPKTYREHDCAVLEYLPDSDGGLVATKTETGWLIRMQVLLQEGCVSDYVLAESKQLLIDWGTENSSTFWKNCTMDAVGKWCFGGFYYRTPDSYTPSGVNYLYRCPASYLCSSFTAAAKYYRFGEDVLIAMLDTLSQLQNKDGFWPTEPESGWLNGDFGIPGGFYDTRFNSDLMDIYLLTDELLGGEALEKTMQRYADFFLRFAQKNHMQTPGGGWYVYDYGHPEVEAEVHTSLNHQLAEIIVLYNLADRLKRPALEILADRMLLAVEDTAADWIKENNDLHYRINPDGSYDRPDYPELTYNDLFDVQQLLERRRGSRSEALDLLMAAKLQWILANGVTNYKQ